MAQRVENRRLRARNHSFSDSPIPIIFITLHTNKILLYCKRHKKPSKNNQSDNDGRAHRRDKKALRTETLTYIYSNNNHHEH